MLPFVLFCFSPLGQIGRVLELVISFPLGCKTPVNQTGNIVSLGASLVKKNRMPWTYFRMATFSLPLWETQEDFSDLCEDLIGLLEGKVTEEGGLTKD